VIIGIMVAEYQRVFGLFGLVCTGNMKCPAMEKQDITRI
jgi:hypothetical protein